MRVQAIIHEKVRPSECLRIGARTDNLRQFGDGIMSMIDCKVNIARKPDPKGDRVVLTFEYVCCLFWMRERS